MQRPNADMPADVALDFNEAAAISAASPRAAAALLRLALEKLCRHLGKKGRLNDMIGALVADGLPTRLQKAFDYVRVVGNGAVHPGQLDVNDDPEVVQTLFRLLNFIVERMITEEKDIDRIYGELPERVREEIDKRDRQKT